MKMKRLMAGLLSLVMMIGTIGVTEVKAAENNYGTEIASNLTSGSYIDDSADVNEDYVYTIVGSDGSIAEISTDAYDGIVEGYWKVTWEEGSFNSNTIQDGQYLIVNRNLQRAIKKDSYCSYGGAAGDVTGDVLYDAKWDAWEWTITKVGDKYTISTGGENPQYMQINSDDDETKTEDLTSETYAVSLSDSPVELRITNVTSAGEKSENYERNTVFIGDEDVDGWLNRRGDNYAGTWRSPDSGSCIRLYKRGYRISDEKLAEVTSEVIGTEWDYSIDTWNAYNNALTEVYSVCDTPSEALAEFEALVAAKDALKVLKTKSVYKKLEGVTEPETGKYVIVNKRGNSVMSNVPTTNEISIGLDVVAGVGNEKNTVPMQEKYVWTIIKKGNDYTIQDQTGKFATVVHNDSKQGILLSSEEATLQIETQGSNTFSIGLNKINGYFNHFDHNPDGVGTYWVKADAGSLFYLYKEWLYVTDLSIAMATKNVGGADSYTSSSWNEYQEALNAAKVEFKTKEEAEEALENLTEKKEALKPSEVESVYKKLAEGAAVDTGKYLIVTADRNKDSALANHKASGGRQFAVVKPVYSADGTVRNIESKYVWLITKKADNSGYTIQDAENKYLYIKENNSDAGLGLIAPENVGSIASNNVIMQIPTPNSTGRLVIGNGSQYLHCYNHTDLGIGTYEDKDDTASNFYLYKENFAVKTELLAELESAVGSEYLYTTATWNVYATALAVVKNGSATKVGAEKAWEDLREAVKALKEIDYSVLNVTFDRYQIDDSKTPLVEDGIYAIVGAHYDPNYGGRQSQNMAIKNGGGFMYEDLGDGPGTAGAANVYDSIPEGKLANSIVYEWEFKSTSETQNTYHVKSMQKNTYLQIRNNVSLVSDPSVVTIRRDDNVKGNTTTYRNLGGIILGNDVDNNVLNHQGSDQNKHVGIWTYQERDNNNHGNTYYLYKKQYRVDTTGLEALVDPSGVYDTTAKAAYDAALTEAKAAVGNAGVVFEKYLALEEATQNLIATMTESVIHATGLTAPTGWTKNTASMDAKLTLGSSTLVKTSGALVFDLMDASAFELLATCGNDTGMVMAVVKDANGKTLRSYLVDTYYATEAAKVNVPIVRDMKLTGGETVDVYACLVKNVVNNRVSTMSVRGRAVEVTTDDIVMALLEELGLENELDVTDVTVSYMSEDSVLKGGTSSSINTYAVAPMLEGNADNTTEYTVSVQGCRIYKPVNGVEYEALSDLVAEGKTAFISKGETEFVLADYQKTGPQNEIYLAQNESIVIGLKSAPSANYFICVTEADGTRSYRELEFTQVEGVEGYAATIKNTTEAVISLGMIKISGVSGEMPAEFRMTSTMAEAVVLAMNAEVDEDVNEVVNPFEDLKEDDYFFDAVLWAVKENITTGVSETLFAPGKDCTRAQVVTFLWRAAGQPEVTNTENPFVDVKTGSYYEKAVLWAVENGITTGVDAEHFAPNNACTRAQFVTFLWRAEGQPEVANAENPFVDVAADSYYEEAVCWAAENDITTGVDAEHFAPQDTCLRRQVVTFLYRAMSE